MNKGGFVPEPVRFVPNFVKEFDRGGVLKPGDVGVNNSRQPELVLTGDQFDRLGGPDPNEIGRAVAWHMNNMRFELDSEGFVRLVDRQIGQRADLLWRASL